MCLESRCRGRVAPVITFTPPAIEIFAGEPAIDVTPSLALGEQDTTAVVAWHTLVAPEGAAPIADFSGASLRFVPLTVGSYAFEVTATHKGGTGRNVLLVRVVEDAFVGQLARDTAGEGFYRMTTSGTLTLLHTRAGSESFQFGQNLDGDTAVYGIADTIRHVHYETAAFSPRGWSSAAPSGATSDCATASPGGGNYCCPSGFVMIDRSPSFYCCPSTHPNATDPQCCPASYRAVDVSPEGSSYPICCPDDALPGYEHDPSRVLASGDYGACVLRTDRQRLSIHSGRRRGAATVPLCVCSLPSMRPMSASRD